jgi:hypothetical protein
MSKEKQVQKVSTSIDAFNIIGDEEITSIIKFNDPDQEGCEFEIIKCEKTKTKIGTITKTSIMVHVKYLDSEDDTIYKGFLPQKYADAKMTPQQITGLKGNIMTVDKVIRIGNNLNGTPKYTPKLTFREKDKQLELE